MRNELRTWGEFTKAFRHQFIGDYDSEDLLDDLRRRTLAKGEKIAAYMSSFKYILSRFKRPPTEEQQAETAYRYLLPEYRRAMSDRIIDSLADIERLGSRWKKQKELDSRYVAPPSADKMRVPGAAFSIIMSRSKVATVRVEEAAAVAETASRKSESEVEKKKRLRKSKQRASEIAAAHVASAQAIMGRFENAPRPQSQPQRQLYSAAFQRSSNESEAGRAAAAQGRAAGPIHAPPHVEQNTAPSRRWSQSAAANYSSQNEQYSGGYQRRNAGDVYGSGNFPVGHGESRFSRPPARRASSSSPRRAFFGACFTCNATGHRASECPDVECFGCYGIGHILRECPERGRKFEEQCQCCGAPEVTVRLCASCAPLFTYSGNG